jgi:hypothetical protein
MHHDQTQVVVVGNAGVIPEWAAIGAPTLPGRLRGSLVHVVGGEADLRHWAIQATIRGALAVVASPVGAPFVVEPGRLERFFRTGTLPWWTRAFKRFVFRSQEEARLWPIQLGRCIVVRGESPEELACVYEEVGRMSRRW